MEFDTIANISSNDTFEPDESYHVSQQNVLDVPVLLTASAGILADFIITYVICRNKVLHTRTNIYIANICICNIFYLIFTPLMLNLFSAAENIHASLICISDEIFFIFMLGNYVFVCILLLDWYVVTFKSLNCSARCRASYQLFIAAVWTSLLVFMITAFLQCTAGISIFPFIAGLAILFYFCSFIFVAFIFIMKIINEKTTSVVEVKQNLELHYAASYFMCWFPSWLYIVTSVFSRRMSTYVGICTFMIGYLYSWILLALMYNRDKKFRSALRKCLCNVEESDIEEDVPKGDEHLTTLI